MTAEEEKDFLSKVAVHTPKDAGGNAIFASVRAGLVDTDEKFDLIMERFELFLEEKIGHSETKVTQQDGRLMIFPDNQALPQ